MKRLPGIIIGLSCLCVLITAWAANGLKVVVNGLDQLPIVEKNVNTALSALQKGVPAVVTRPVARKFYEEAPIKIREAIEPYGFFHSTIQHSLEYQNHQWQITFNIKPGTPVMVDHITIDIEGDAKHDKGFLRSLKTIPLKVGQRFTVPDYDKTKQTLFDEASERGYFKAQMVENKVLTNLTTNKASITLKFDSGKRFRFGKTQFNKTPFSQKFLRRYLDYHNHQHFLNHHVEQTQQNLTDADYFEQVNVNPLTSKNYDYTVPVKIHLTPRKPNQYIFGLGFGTDTGPRALIGYTRRWIGSYGNYFNTLIQASTQNNNAVASYNIPGSNPTKDLHTFSAGVGNTNDASGKSKSAKVAYGYRTMLGQNWKQQFSMGWLSENYDIKDFPRTNTSMFYPSIEWDYVKYKNRLNPKNGISFTVTLAGTPKFLSSREGFTQITADMRTLNTIPWTHTRLITHLAGGRTDIKDIIHLPYSLQTFIGGARSLRGYQYQQIGPGKNMFIASGEIQQRIYGNFYIAGFCDAGNVTNKNPTKDLNVGVGPGLVWLSPVGALELTFANAITSHNKPWVIQFSMGPTL